jgi:hypothetical protein
MKMGKTIDRDLATGDEPWFTDAIIIGPVRIYRPSAKDGEPKSKDDEWSKFPEVAPDSDDENAAT